MTLIVPMPPKVLSPNGRPGSHFALARAKKKYLADVFWLTKEAVQQGRLVLPDTALIGVRIVCHPRGPTQPDDDNVTGSFKAGRDGMAKALKIDDKRMRYLPVVFGPSVAGGELRITLHPLTDGSPGAE